MTCPCDPLIHPQKLNIAAGLESIPRQIANFAQFRGAMLGALHHHGELAAWRARDEDDLGVMLLEMWAYVCDVLAFYDEVIAHECYVRTARRRPSLRKLVGLLGYLPRPAVAASVKLAVKAEGRKVVALPRGTAFLSGAFDSEAPQVFELDAVTKIHPFNNQFSLKQPRPEKLGDASKSYKEDYLLLKPATVNLKVGDLVLVHVTTAPTKNQILSVAGIADKEGKDGEKYVQVNFDDNLTLPVGVRPDQIMLLSPTQMASLWMLSAKPLLEPLNRIILDGLYRQIKPGDDVILAVNSERNGYTVESTSELMKALPPLGSTEVKDKDKSGKTYTITPPPIKVPITALFLSPKDQKLSKYQEAPNKTRVYYGFIDAGTVAVEAKTTFADSDPLEVSSTIDTSKDHTLSSRFLLEDKNETGVEVTGTLDAKTCQLKLDNKWAYELVAPVQLFGNVVTASRGETVAGEILGSGNASVANQSFKLLNKPLTYIPSPTTDNERAVKTTLEIYVNGIRWTEVESFFKAKPDAEVYVVRQNDQGESLITFGDGRHGARLATGTNNVTANYRYGAGANTPPAGSITQLGSPLKDLQSVHNPMAASGGGDADKASELQANGPRSVLTLGRAVSLQDFEALAASYPGVKAARAEWRWHGIRQRPVAQIWYIGKLGIEHTLTTTLRNRADPGVALDVDQAKPLPLRLSLHVDLDPRHDDKVVLKKIRQRLLEMETGMLAPANIGIGRPLYRSHLFAEVLAVPGTLSVSDIQHDGKTFTEIAIYPGAGYFYDLTRKDGALVLNSQENACD